MKVSIALTVYRGEEFLEVQLASLGEQTRKPDEVIITDDSPDRSLESLIVDCAARFGLPISYHYNETNLGSTRNFEKALSLTTGDVVFFCDQDDRWFPDKIAKALAAFERDPALLVVMNDAEFTDNELTPLGTTKIGQMRRAGIREEAFVMGCCAAMRRELVDIALPLPDGVTHDHWLVGFGDTLGATLREHEVRQLYRIHEKNVSKDFFVNAEPGHSATRLGWEKVRRRVANYRSSDNLMRDYAFFSRVMRRAEERGLAADNRFAANLAKASQRLRQLEHRLSLRASNPASRLASLLRKGLGDYERPSQIAKDLLASRIDKGAVG